MLEGEALLGSDLLNPGVLFAGGSLLTNGVLRLVLWSVPRESELDNRTSAEKQKCIERVAALVQEVFHQANQGTTGGVRGNPPQVPDRAAELAEGILKTNVNFQSLVKYETTISTSYNGLTYLLLLSILILVCGVIAPDYSKLVAATAILSIFGQGLLVINIRRCFGRVRQHERRT